MMTNKNNEKTETPNEGGKEETIKEMHARMGKKFKVRFGVNIKKKDEESKDNE